LTYKEIREEVVARGFDDFAQSDARIKRWVNQAYREITDAHPWPFLEETKEGTAPVTVSDLGHVLSVSNKTNESILGSADRRQIVGLDPKIDDTASVPSLWYREGETSVKVWPADTTSTFVIRYLKVPAELKEDSDEPVIPKAYQDLIVDGAVIRAYKNRDNFEAAQFVRGEWEGGIRQMVHALLRPNYDSDYTVIRTGYPSDYL
jgi:hypothetical protein